MTGIDLSAPVGIVAALGLLAGCATAALAIAGRTHPGGSASVRVCAALLAANWLLTTAFFALSAAGAFRAGIAVPAFLGLAVAAWWRLAHGRRLPLRIANDASAAWSLVWRDRGTGGRALALAVAALVTARLLRGLAAPPMAWDALVYHLVKAGIWVQSGNGSEFVAPNWWCFYRHFSPGGDILWAWAMLPVHGDDLLAPAGAIVWVTGLVATYALAREVGARQDSALLAAGAVALAPCAINYMTASYVDLVLLADILLACVFAARALRTGEPQDILLAAAGFGLAAGAKHSGLPLAAFGIALALSASRRHRVPAPGALLLVVTALVIACVAGLPGYVRALVEEGSPLYPFPLDFAGRRWLEGNAELEAWLEGRIAPESKFRLNLFLAQLFVRWNIAKGLQHMNLGPAAVFLIALGFVGVVRLLRRRSTIRLAVLLAGVASVNVASVVAAGSPMYWTTWSGEVGRLFLPALGVLAAAGAPVSGRVARGLRVAGVLCGLVLGVPLGWCADDVRGVAVLVTAAAGLTLTLLLLLRGGRWRRLSWTVAASVPALLLFSVAVDRVRRELRYPLYVAIAELRAYDHHPLSARFAAAWPIWARLDGERPSRIAVTYGWEVAKASNAYLYPFLGRRLQNEIIYVPPTRDGSLVSHSKFSTLRAKADEGAWLERLRASRVDYVVALGPEPLEAAWMKSRPDLFELVATSSDRKSRAYRIRDRAEDGRPGTGLASPPRVSPPPERR